MTNQVPYFQWREGRPRWEPGPTLRRQGFKGRDLRDESGGWLDFGNALKAASAINDEVAAWRRTGVRGDAKKKRVVPARSCQALYDLYTGGEEEKTPSPKWARLRPSTKVEYKSKLRTFLAEFGDKPVAAIETAHLYRWWEELHETRGHSAANGTIRVVSALLAHARRIGWRRDNPASELGMDGVAPRVVTWTPSEIAHLVKTADEMGQAAIGDAIVIALHTGQRRGDVLALELPQVVNGRAVFRQLKTGSRVSVPHTPQLQERLEAIRRRRALSGTTVVDLELARRVVLDDKGRAFDGDAGKERFGVYFAAVRAEAAKAMPAIAAKQFLDLRDTAVTRLALAECTVPEIRAITGHKLATVHQVLAHYLANDDRMADTAIEKLTAWIKAEGIPL